MEDGREAGIGAELQGGCTAARGENGISGERC